MRPLVIRSACQDFYVNGPARWFGWMPGATSLIWMNSRVIHPPKSHLFDLDELHYLNATCSCFFSINFWLCTHLCLRCQVVARGHLLMPFPPPPTSFFALHATVSQRSPTPHPKLQIAAPFHSSNSQYHSVLVFIVNQYSVTSAHINGGDCPKIKKNSGPCVLFGDKGTKCPLKCRQTSMTDTFNQTNTIKALLFPWCVYSICFVCIS